MRSDAVKRGNELLGREYITNNYGKCFIIGYKNARNVLICFYEPFCIVKCYLSNLKIGNVFNPMCPSFYKKGYMGVGKYSSKDKEVFSLWYSMLDRAYSDKYHINQPTYKDVTVCEEWLNFQNFATWCESQEFFNAKDSKGRRYEIDKDLLIKDNRIYSPKACCFIPREVNITLVRRLKSRGEYPIGVTYCKSRNTFVAKFGCNNSTRYLGSFDNIEEAFQAYKVAKENHIKDLAVSLLGKIDDNVYKALINYEVNIND